MRIIELEQNTDAWIKYRSDKVTASNAITLLTKGKDAAIQKNNQKFGGNFWTERGHLLEVEALDLYEQIKGVKLQRGPVVENDDFKDAASSHDGIDMANITNIESKSFGKSKHLSIETVDDLPAEVIAQVNFQMMISLMPKTIVILYHPKVDPKLAFKMIEVLPDRKIIDRLIAQLRESR